MKNQMLLAFLVPVVFLFGARPAIGGDRLVINEILADPGSVNDSNGDGKFDPVADEFIEIANVSGDELDMSGWMISDRVGVRHLFAEGTVVPADCAIVIFGSGPIGRAFTGAVFQISSTGTLALNNSGDTITLADNEGITEDTVEYDAVLGNNDQSFTRDPDLGEFFVQHTQSPDAAGTMSPGTLVDGSAFSGCDSDPAPRDTGWIINEFHVAPDAAAGDAGGDGSVDADTDEFVEIVNATGAERDISGWVLADGVVGRHLFAPGTIVADSCAVVVFGGGSIEIETNGSFLQPASSGRLDLDDAGDSITLVSTAPEDVNQGPAYYMARVTYGAEAAGGGSRTRNPDLTDGFVDHSTAAGAPFSPGTRNDGTRFSGCSGEPPAPASEEIWAIQGSGLRTPLDGQTVLTIDNIVTGVARNGFFLQTPEDRSDGDPETSDGIFVFTNNAPTVAVGDVVDVVGDVQEFFDWTELTNPIVTVKSSGNPLPEPVFFDELVPSPDQPQPDNEMERYENMLIEVQGGTVTSARDRFGNFLVVAGPERAYREPGRRVPDKVGIPEWDGNPQIFEVDPDALGLAGVSPPAGARIEELSGPFAYRFCRYRVFPSILTVDVAIEPTPVRDRADGEFTVATQNLDNLVDDIDDPGTDEEVVDSAEFRTRLAKSSLWIRDVLKSPDILCLQEVENDAVVRALAERIADDDPSVSYSTVLEPGNDPGGRNVGFLVRDTVEVEMVTQIGKDATFDFQGGSPQLYSRPPLILEARFTGGGASFPITVIGVHLRSLGGIDDVDQGPFVREKRLAQAQFLADEVQRRQAAGPDVHLVVAGDFNAFQFTDGLVDVVGLVSGLQNPDEVLLVGDNVVDPPLTNQVLSLPENERYSTVFQGNAEVLDHVLTSGSLEALVRGSEFGRGNADATPEYEASPETPLAVSDHDGLVVYIEPSAAGPRFIRADANADGNVNLADGIFVLNFLFVGDASPPCMEAANANGDGTVNLADGIFVLNFLFGGDARPPAPNPDCDFAPTPLGCDSFSPCL